MEWNKKIKLITSDDKENLIYINNFLLNQGLHLDIVDECGVLFSNNDQIIGVVCRYCNNLKCLAIHHQYQNQNIASSLITYMMHKIYNEGFNEVFVFTKPNYGFIFQNLGFDIIYNNQDFVFLTNRYDLFLKYIDYLKSKKKNSSNSGIIILNANPFTKGHEFLIKKASRETDWLYIMVVKEESSFFDYQKRLEMVKLGVKKIKKVIILEGSNYLISKNVFPAYFLPSSEIAIKQQTILDTYIFINHIASILDIQKRFVGEEPYSPTTHYYNVMMHKMLYTHNLKLIIFPRLQYKNKMISATQVRKLFIEGNFLQINPLVPLTTLIFLKKLNYLEYKNNPILRKLVNKKY